MCFLLHPYEQHINDLMSTIESIVFTLKILSPPLATSFCHVKQNPKESWVYPS